MVNTRIKGKRIKAGKEKENSHNEAMNNEGKEIPGTINDIRNMLNNDFTKCSDFIIREIEINKLKKKVLIAYIEGFIDKEILSVNVIDPILKFNGENENNNISNLLQEKIISSCSITEIKDYEGCIEQIVSGDAVIFIDGENVAFRIGVKAPEKRAVEEASMEVTIKGSREGFTESLTTNLILLRRRIKNKNFKVESFKIGETTRSDLAICYIEGIVNSEIVDEVKNRINPIKIDGLIGSGYIEQFIQDGKYPLFPMIGNSDKPDKVAAKLLEGRIAIIVDGTPTVLTVPFLFIETIQIQEDYFGEYYFASFMRMLRFISFLIAVYLPAMYVAISAFHQTIIPFKLMLTMVASREGIPFSPFLEALFMILTFEILREAGIRMPRAIGQAVSIVGAIVLGDAAVSAGIASAPLIIIAALSGICSFIVPPLMKVESLLRIAMLVVADILGLLGIGVLTIILIAYLCSKRSFGIPYMVPFSPLVIEDLKDTFIVVPVWKMFTRPAALTEGQNMKRTTGKSFGGKDDS